MRVYNFSAGPSMLPLPVLQKVQKEFLDYNNTGMSVTEMSHRSKPFMAIVEEAVANTKELMHIPDNYDVIFVQGGASLQFEAVPLNLLTDGKADYVVTGNFAKKAYTEAKKFGDIRCAASSEDKNFTYIPTFQKDTFRSDADYVHICYNNTIFGTHFSKKSLPTIAQTLVADCSSCIMGEQIDVSKFGIIYAGAQKNLAPAGVTMVIVRKDLAQNPMAICPTMLKYSTQIKENSLYNTPPAFSLYVLGEVLKWLIDLGGVAQIEIINKQKAAMLYETIDNSSFYKNHVRVADRSIMNIPFVTPTAELDEKFIKEATANGLCSLKGHRLVGGMRASIYNAVPLEAIQALVGFMKKFEKDNR